MTGYIRKYYADIADPYLCDDGIVADPDFFTNKSVSGNVIPTWAVCGPYLRIRLKEEDVVFFVPVIERLRQIGFEYYICTGLLIVDEILPDKTDLLRHPSINAKFKQLYLLDLTKHLNKDRPRTKAIRKKKIILGDESRSMWFGRNSIDLSRALKELGMVDLSRRLTDRHVRRMSEEETLRLQDYLKSKIIPIQDRTHSHWNREAGDRRCKTCYPN